MQYKKYGKVQGEFERLFDEVRRDGLGPETAEIKKVSLWRTSCTSPLK
jgi:hypothetical protein